MMMMMMMTAIGMVMMSNTCRPSVTKRDIKQTHLFYFFPIVHPKHDPLCVFIFTVELTQSELVFLFLVYLNNRQN